jgi:hypothetical protein
MPLVTRMFASSEHAWDPMASSSVNFCRKRAPCTTASAADLMGDGVAAVGVAAAVVRADVRGAGEASSSSEEVKSTFGRCKAKLSG